MEYKGEGIEALAALIEEMKRSSLIFLDKKVKELLKLLAYYDEFRYVLTEVNKNYNHADGKRRALVTFVGNDVIKIPTDNKELVAFVSNLLVEFDSGEMDIMDFASRYFPSDSTQNSINLFMTELMDPFKKALAYLVVNGVEEEYKGEGRVVAFAANGIYEQTESIIVHMIDEINESNLNEKDKEDCFLMLEGLAAALDTRDILMIRAIWCGLKKEFEKNNLCKVQIGRMEEQMKLYLVLK